MEPTARGAELAGPIAEITALARDTNAGATWIASLAAERIVRAEPAQRPRKEAGGRPRGAARGLVRLRGALGRERRPEQQRGALDRFAGVDARLERYRKLRDEWQIARRDLVDEWRAGEVFHQIGVRNG